MHWKNNVTFIFVTIQCCHGITGGAYHYFIWIHNACTFWAHQFLFHCVKINTKRVYPVTSVLLESVRFSVSKHVSCETIAVDVLVVLSSCVFICFDTRKSVKENVVCSSTFSAKFPKKVIEILSVLFLKMLFLN